MSEVSKKELKKEEKKVGKVEAEIKKTELTLDELDSVSAGTVCNPWERTPIPTEIHP